MTLRSEAKKIYHKILQYNVAAIFLLVSLLIIAEYMSYQYNPHDSVIGSAVKKLYFAPVLKDAQEYFDAYDAPLQTDEYIMHAWLRPEHAADKERVFDKDPFDRILSVERSIEDYAIVRRVDSGEEVISLYTREGGDAPLYDVDVQYQSAMIDPTDEIISKALYCDSTGYDHFDRELLGLIRDHEGGYGDTHHLLGLLILEKLECLSSEELQNDKIDVINKIIAAQEDDQEFSDLYAERIVLLYWAGRGDAVTVGWIEEIARNVREDRGWSDHGEEGSNPHTTGLSALAIKYFIEGKVVQNILLR